MDRIPILHAVAETLFGIKAAYDGIVATAVKRNHDRQRIVAALLAAEIAERPARSIRYQMGVARLPLANDIDEFPFDGTPINENLIRDIAGGGLVTQQRNVVLIRGSGAGRTHLAVARFRIRGGMRGAAMPCAHAPARWPTSCPRVISFVARFGDRRSQGLRETEGH